MSNEKRQRVEAEVVDEAIDLDTDTAGELDQAMQEALEAIEGQEDEGGKPGGAEEQLVAVQREADAQRERALRTMADLENYRKRVQRERQDETKFRAFEPMRELLDVLDNLERALASDGTVDDLKAGVEMIRKQMGNLLENNKVERVNGAVGQAFDPSVHEAVSRHEDPNVTAPTVSEELQAGYTMHDRLLRPSVVKVAMPPIPGDKEDDDDG